MIQKLQKKLISDLLACPSIKYKFFVILAILLKQWQGKQGKIKLVLRDKWYSAKNVFTTDDGKIINPSIGPKCFSNFLKKNNFKHIRSHDLRHTLATLLISNNVDVKTISSKLGHAETYTFIFNSLNISKNVIHFIPYASHTSGIFSHFSLLLLFSSVTTVQLIHLEFHYQV